jgi:hypothetical protein
MAENKGALTNEELTAALDKESALIGGAMTDMHSSGISMLEALERLEQDGLFAPDSNFPRSEEFLEIRFDLSFLAESLSDRFPDFVGRVQSFFDRIDGSSAMNPRKSDPYPLQGYKEAS